MKLQFCLKCYLASVFFGVLTVIAMEQDDDQAFLVFYDLDLEFWKLGYRAIKPKSLRLFWY